MMTIGLTGGTGSGKGVVSKILRERKALILDADEYARKVVEPGEPAYNEIAEHFGKDIFDEDGILIRHKLGDIVFNDAKELEFLNKCTHKYISELILKEIKYAQENPDEYDFVVFDAPQLIESGMDSLCDEIWVVTADCDIRIKRIMERDGITKEQAESRIASQLTFEQFKAVADRIIFNNGSLEEVEEQVENIFKMLKE